MKHRYNLFLNTILILLSPVRKEYKDSSKIEFDREIKLYLNITLSIIVVVISSLLSVPP